MVEFAKSGKCVVMLEKKIERERERQKCVYLHSIDLIFLKKYF
jgi:hypothetical protein